jgi:hypothetical protein
MATRILLKALSFWFTANTAESSVKGRRNDRGTCRWWLPLSMASVSTYKEAVSELSKAGRGDQDVC